MEIEEVKVKENNKQLSPRIEDSRPATELNIQFDDYNQRTEGSSAFTNEILVKVRKILMNRRKYQALCIHKILSFIPPCMWKYKGLMRK